MKIILNNKIDRLDIHKVKRILCLTYRNYRPDLKFDFPSGAIEINTFQVNKIYFDDIQHFYIHVKSLPYLNYSKFEIPSHILNMELYFEYLDKDKFSSYANGYLESFKDLSEDSFWMCEIDSKGFVQGYKLETIGSELILIAEFDNHYFSFCYQSID